MPSSRQARHCASASVEHVQRQRPDQAGVLGERDELVREEQPALGMLPAHERLDAAHAAGWAGRPWAGSGGRARRSSSARRRSAISVRRPASCSVAARPRRARTAGAHALATYIATSARCRRLSTSVAVVRVERDADRRLDVERAGPGRRTAARARSGSRSATVAGEPRWRQVGDQHARTRRRRAARPCRSSRSDALEPRADLLAAARRRSGGRGVSLISLKRSRSMSSTATRVLSRCAWLSAACRGGRGRASGSGRPVSASWNAW